MEHIKLQLNVDAEKIHEQFDITDQRYQELQAAANNVATRTRFFMEEETDNHAKSFNVLIDVAKPTTVGELALLCYLFGGRVELYGTMSRMYRISTGRKEEASFAFASLADLLR